MSIRAIRASYARENQRTCKKCEQAMAIDRFPEYLERGRVYRRHVCMTCQMAYVADWKARQSQARYRERRTILRSIVSTMIGAGMTRQEIARYAGLSRNTVSRILNGTDSRMRFQQPTEDRLLTLFLDVKERAA